MSIDVQLSRRHTLHMLPSEPSFGARLRAALDDPSTTADQAVMVAAALREQRDQVDRLCGRSYLLFVTFAAAYSLLSTHAMRAFDVSGVSISNEGATALLLPLMAAYFAYRSAAAATAVHLFESAIHSYWRSKLMPFVRERITDLLTTPTPFGVEAMLGASAPPFLRKVSRASSMAIAIVLLVVPILWFALATMWVWQQSAWMVFRLIATIVIWLFVVRSVLFGVQLMFMLYREIKDTAATENRAVFEKLEQFEAAAVKAILRATSNHSGTDATSS